MATDRMNVVDLPQTATTEIQAGLEAARRNLPFVIEYASLQAQIKYANFAALVKAGFSEAQALELVARAH